MKEFVKSNELSQIAEISPATIKFYSEQGLLPFIQNTRPNGHKIFNLRNGLKRLREIKSLQEKGYSIEMIKNKLGVKAPMGGGFRTTQPKNKQPRL